MGRWVLGTGHINGVRDGDFARLKRGNVEIERVIVAPFRDCY